MKKRVRIYKAGGQSDAVSQEDIYKYIADTMSAEDYDGDTDAISEKLAQVGIDSNTADAYIDEVDTYLKENNSDKSDEEINTEEAQLQAEQEQAALEEQNAAEEEARQAQLYAMYNTDTEEGVPDDNADEEIISRYGGAKPSKRSFINQYTKLAKKAQGGDTPSPGANDVLGGREQHVSNFFKGISESVNSAQQKQAAEEQYNAIYGNPQVGAYAQDGGSQNLLEKNNIDFEGYNEKGPWMGEEYNNLGTSFNKGKVSLDVGNSFPTKVNQPTGLFNPYASIGVDLNKNRNLAVDLNPGYAGFTFTKSFEDGGIQQQQIDTESPYDHLAKDTAARRHIFSDNMYTQNDVAAMEQYGGFTDSDSGLYKFIGGGDNESADEQYQDSDLNYQRYAKRGGALHKYVNKGEVTEASLVSPIDGHTYTDEEIAANKEQTDKTATSTDTEDYKKKYNELIAQNTTNADAQKQQQMMQQYMMQQYMQQMGNQGGYGQGMFRSPIISRGEQYNKAINSPYYTQSGENYTGPDLANRLATSVNVTKTNVFGRPKRYTVNYGATPKISSFKTPTYTPGQSNTESGEPGIDINNPSINNKQSFGERVGRGMVNTKIPGIQQLGAKLIPSGIGYEGSNVTNESESNNLINRFKEKYPKFNDFGQGDSNASNVNPIAPGINPTANEPYYPPMSSRAQRRENRDDKKANREYGGPVDYTEYAYGGDVSISELYKAQTGFEINTDKCPVGSTKDYKGDCVDGQGNVTKKRNTDFKMAEPEDLLENPFSQPKKNPLTGETPGVQVDSSGNYVNEGIKYGDQPNVSQDFKNKQAWDISKKGFGNASILIGNAFANTADEVRANRQENQLLANTTSAESNFGINNGYNQGDYDPNSGLFRPDEMGAMQSKYGGGIYATGGNTEDEDTQYMTQEEIDDFIANGGELEYL